MNVSAEKKAYKRFIREGMTPQGACGLIANLEEESDGFYPNRVEYLCLKRLKENGKTYTDQTYTKAVNDGQISREEFLNPLPNKQYGYGLAQWTSPGRKAGLYDLAKERGASIAKLKLQLDYLMQELEANYPSVLRVLRNTNSIREASDIVLKKFEMPSDTSETVCSSRAARGQKFYDNYVKSDLEEDPVEAYTSQMEEWANDDSHGYDQIYRWGEKGDFDCSAAVIQAMENSGIPAKSNGATYTGNMLAVLLKLGFKDVIDSVNLSSGDGMKRGDILLNVQHHVAVYCGNGREVEASINEKGTATGGQPGDQTGKEFLVRSYRNYPWTNILRYKGNATVPTWIATGTAISSVDNLYVRSTTNGFILGELMKGNRFEVDGKTSGKWTHVKVSGIGIGWVYTSYIKHDGEASQDNSKDAIKNKQDKNERLFVGKVTASVLNVRTWAGTEYPNIQSYPVIEEGNLVDVMNYTQKDASGNSWYYVRIAGQFFGFVSAQYIKKV